MFILRFNWIRPENITFSMTCRLCAINKNITEAEMQAFTLKQCM